MLTGYTWFLLGKRHEEFLETERIKKARSVAAEFGMDLESFLKANALMEDEAYEYEYEETEQPVEEALSQPKGQLSSMQYRISSFSTDSSPAVLSVLSSYS